MAKQEKEKQAPNNSTIIGDVKGTTVPSPGVIGKKIIDAKETHSHRFWDNEIGGREDDRENKQKWSRFIMVALIVTLGLQWVVVFLVGWNVFDFNFREYDLFLPALLINTLVQIVGLALVVVKGLFKK